MKHLFVVMSLAFVNSIVVAQTAFGTGDRAANTTQGTHGSNRAAACKVAKDAANAWVERNIGLTFAYAYQTSVSDCSCDQAPPVRSQKLCLTGTSECDSYGRSTEMIVQPHVCNVDAQINRTEKKK